MTEFKGNIQKPQAGAPGSQSRYQPSYGRALLFRVLSVFPIGEVVFQLATGRGYLLTRYGNAIPVSLHDDSTSFFITMGAYLYIAAAWWFLVPYHRWVFTLKLPLPLPEPPDDWTPKGKLVLPNWSDFYEPTFLKSVLILLCLFGLMATLFGTLQAAMGEVYAPFNGELEVFTLKDDPLGYLQALIPYAVIGFVTLGLGTIAYLWHPESRRTQV